MTSADVEQIYTERQARFRRAAEEAERAAGRISNLRLASFLAALLLAGWAIFGETDFAAILIALAGLALAGFLALLVRHQRVLGALERARGLAEINTQALARLKREWSGLPSVPVESAVASLPLAGDLDLFGPRSLFQLLAQPCSPLGRRMLARWLVEPAEPEGARGRQTAVKELAPRIDFRQELALLGRTIRNTEVEPFLKWTREPSWLDARPWLIPLARVMPALLIGSALLQVIGVVPFGLWLVVLLVNITLSFLFCGHIHAIFARIARRSAELQAYVRLLELMHSWAPASTELRRLLAQAGTAHQPAHRELDRLRRIMDCADLRFSQMVYGVVQGVTLWDFHILWLAERWQRESGQQAQSWFEALAQYESLAALANLAHDEPRWVYPTFLDSRAGAIFAAEQLGHPLLAGRSRVANDVTVGPPGTFLLVTGSNMSGKSTLLRSIGVNVVLAQAGAPVCATRCELPPIRLGTSIRVQDSLGDGVSLFMAELKRLKQVVDEALATEREGERVFLYLLDEILHGTNTVERQIAVRRVLQHLLKHQAIGAISTHDLALAEVDALTEGCRPVHFRESFRTSERGHEMTFDYQLRPGVATTTNALKLLEMVGLSLNGEAPHETKAEVVSHET